MTLYLVRHGRPLVERDQPASAWSMGAVWTLLAAELTGTSPDLKRWEALGFPDVIELGRPGSQGG